MKYDNKGIACGLDDVEFSLKKHLNRIFWGAGEIIIETAKTIVLIKNITTILIHLR
jgi:hypothetical protein